MIYLNAFLFSGLLCVIAQCIYDNTKLTPGHITSLFVVLGAFLDGFHIYDFILEKAGMGASLPITSFGHSLAHASYMGAIEKGWLGLITGMFDKTAGGIAFAIFMAFAIAICFKSRS